MAEFLAMGGYAQFVWSAFGFWLACLIFNIVSARRKIRASLEHAAIAAARQRHRQKRSKERKLKQS
jgi:heme exporter protein D